jgi:hypothetical protein
VRQLYLVEEELSYTSGKPDLTKRMCFKKIISPFNVFLQFLFLFKEALATTLTQKIYVLEIGK